MCYAFRILDDFGGFFILSIQGAHFTINNDLKKGEYERN